MKVALALWLATMMALVAAPAHAAQTEPSWPHQTLTAPDGAVAWVDSGVEPGATMRVRGSGWTNRAGTAPSTIAIKLNSSPNGAQFTRSGSGIVAHPSASGDKTIWILLDAEAGTHPNQRVIAPDGSFDITVDVPGALTKGAYFTASITSGLFQDGDQTRSLQTKPLEVAGEAWDSGEEDEDVTCVPTVSPAQVEVVNAQHELGGDLVLRGSGWCADSGGSRIGMKIDEGGISRIDSSLHSNRTIWAIIDARGADGSFEVSIPLPDGTAKTSAPALAEGVHTLRFLSGTLKPGDQVRSVSAEFQVGSYKPVFPEPVEANEALTNKARNGVVAEVRGKHLVITHPGAVAGDWVALTAFEGASPRLPWGATWFRVGKDGTVRAALKGATLPKGKVKLSLQTGNEGVSGQLIGWTWVTLAEADSTQEPSDGEPDDKPSAPPSTPTPSTPTPVVAPVGPAPSVAPVQVAAPAPGAPVAAAADLVEANAGDLITTQMGERLRVSLPGVKPSRVVHIFVYAAQADPVAAGAAVVAADRSVKIALTGAAPGSYKVVLVNLRGTLIGWVPFEVEAPDVSTQASVAAPVRTAGVATTPSADKVGPADWWMVGVAAAMVLGSASIAIVRLRKAN